MNFKAMAYHIIKKNDLHHEPTDTLINVFILFCLYHGYQHEGSSDNFKNDLSWLLWAIVLKHQKARNDSRLINALLFLGADPNYKVTPVMPSVNEVLNSTRLTPPEIKLLKECLATANTNQTLIADIPVMVLSVTNGIDTKNKPLKKTSMVITKQNNGFQLSYSDPEAASQLIGFFLWIGYTHGAEHIVANHPQSIKKLRLEICTHALIGRPEEFDLIYDDSLRAEVFRFIAKYMLGTNMKVTSHIYTLINNKYPVEQIDTGVNFRALLVLAQTNSLEIFKVLVSSFSINIDCLRQAMNCKDLTAALFTLLINLRKTCTSHEHVTEILNWIDGNYKKYFPEVLSSFWLSLSDEVNEKPECLVSTRALAVAMLKGKFYGRQFLQHFLAKQFTKGHNETAASMIDALTDEQFMDVFEFGDFYQQLNFNVSNEQADLLIKRHHTISNNSNTKLQTRNRMFLCSLAGIALHSNNIYLLEQTLIAGFDPYTSLPQLPSFFVGAVDYGSVEFLLTILKYRPFDLLSTTDASYVGGKLLRETVLPARISPININTLKDFNSAEALISQPSVKEGAEKAYFEALKARKAQPVLQGKAQESEETVNKTGLKFHASTAPRQIETTKSILLIDNHFKQFSHEEKVEWVLTNREAIIKALHLRDNPENYSRLLASFISGRRHDLLALFLSLNLPIDVHGIKRGMIKFHGSKQKSVIHNFRPLTFAVFEGDLEAVRLLKEAGAELMLHKDDEQSPLSLAMESIHPTIIDYLLDNMTVSDINRQSGRKFLNDFRNALKADDFKAKDKFLAMARRCSFRCLLELAIIGILAADDAYLTASIEIHHEANLIEVCETLLNLLFTTYRDKRDRETTLSFVKKALSTYSMTINLYDVLRTLVYNLKINEVHDDVITDALANSFLEAVIDHAITLPAIETKDYNHIKGLLSELNCPRFIVLVPKFLPAFKLQAADTQLIDLLVTLATTAIKCKNYPTATLIIEKCLPFLSFNQMSNLLWEATQSNEASLVTVLVGGAHQSKLDVPKMLFNRQSSEMCSFKKATQYRDNNLLRVFSAYLLSESSDLTCYSVELFNALHYARSQGNILGGEIVCQSISKLTPLMMPRDDKGEETTNKEAENCFEFTTPDTGKPAKVRVESYEQHSLCEASREKLAQIFKDSVEGRSGSIRAISKYREYGIHYKIRFFDPNAGDRRAYLKQKPGSELQYEFFTAPKHR